MERLIIIMIRKILIVKKSKSLFLILILLFTSLLCKSQGEANNNDINPDSDEHEYLKYHVSQINFLPIDSVLNKVWCVHIKNQNCLPLIKGNLIFPSVVEKVVVDAQNGSIYSFGSYEAIKLFKKEKLDSIICLPSNDSISLLNIYSGKVIFTYKRYLLPGDEGPFFPENNILYYSGENVLYAYNYKDNKTLWQTKIDDYTKNLIKEYKNYIILNDKNNLLIIDKKTGEIIQKFRTRYYNSDTLIGSSIFYGTPYEIIKINLETLKKDSIVNDKSLFLEKTFKVEGDLIFYASMGRIYYYSISKKNTSTIPDKKTCSSNFVKIKNYFFSKGTEDEDGVFTQIYDINKGLPIYKYFFVKKDGDFCTYDRCLYSFNPNLTSNGLLIGYTIRGEIQAFKFRK